MITIFTPTYNRAQLLPRLYESLCRQTYRNFEWIVVDDGSTDQTAELFGAMHNAPLKTQSPQAPLKGGVQSGSCPPSPLKGEQLSGSKTELPPLQGGPGGAPGLGGLKFITQPNGGKHRAINRGVREARGELFFIVDSDDWLPDDALQTVAERWEAVRNNPKIGGVCGQDMTPDGKVIGSGLPSEELVCSSLDIRLKHHVTGDLKEVFRTEVLREMPFPEFEGEKFCPEALAWNRIAQKYDLLFFSRPIYIAEYQPGGLTDRIVRVRMQSPMASMTCYSELVSYDIPLKEKLKAAINYWRFRLCGKAAGNMPRLPKLWNLAMPLGWLLHQQDLKH